MQTCMERLLEPQRQISFESMSSLMFPAGDLEIGPGLAGGTANAPNPCSRFTLSSGSCRASSFLPRCIEVRTWFARVFLSSLFCYRRSEWAFGDNSWGIRCCRAPPLRPILSRGPKIDLSYFPSFLVSFFSPAH